MLKVTHTMVYELSEAMVASGFPMLSEYVEKKFVENVIDVEDKIYQSDYIPTITDESTHIQRAIKLASAPDGSGHRTFLSGILVCMNVTASIKWWVQFGRYHFQQIDSSMSTMHRLHNMSSSGTIHFNEKTDPRVIAILDDLVAKGADTETIAYSCPAGLELTARVNTNYLQLRTILVQRQHHKLHEWHDFCDWIKSLPFAKEFIQVSAK